MVRTRANSCRSFTFQSWCIFALLTAVQYGRRVHPPMNSLIKKNSGSYPPVPCINCISCSPCMNFTSKQACTQQLLMGDIRRKLYGGGTRRHGGTRTYGSYDIIYGAHNCCGIHTMVLRWLERRIPCTAKGCNVWLAAIWGFVWHERTTFGGVMIL